MKKRFAAEAWLIKLLDQLLDKRMDSFTMNDYDKYSTFVRTLRNGT